MPELEMMMGNAGEQCLHSESRCESSWSSGAGAAGGGGTTDVAGIRAFQESEDRRVSFALQVEYLSEPRVPNSSKNSQPESILKDFSQVFVALEDENETKQVIKRLHRGSMLVKFKPCVGDTRGRRHVFLSEDGSELRWRRPGLRGSLKGKSLQLASVIRLAMGTKTKAFSRFNYQAKQPWYCFSLITLSKTYDFECLNKDDFMLWYFGLQKLIPLSSYFYNRAQVNWRIALAKTSWIGRNSRIATIRVWKEIVRMVKTGNADQCPEPLMKQLKRIQGVHNEE